MRVLVDSQLGEQAELLRRSQVVPHRPALHQLPLGHAVPVNVIHREPLARRGVASKLTVLGAAGRDATCHHVPFGDHFLYPVVGVREGVPYPAVDAPEALDAALMLWD